MIGCTAVGRTSSQYNERRIAYLASVNFQLQELQDGLVPGGFDVDRARSETGLVGPGSPPLDRQARLQTKILP